jgi:hypothetical protein
MASVSIAPAPTTYPSAPSVFQFANKVVSCSRQSQAFENLARDHSKSYFDWSSVVPTTHAWIWSNAIRASASVDFGVNAPPYWLVVAEGFDGCVGAPAVPITLGHCSPHERDRVLRARCGTLDRSAFPTRPSDTHRFNPAANFAL